MLEFIGAVIILFDEFLSLDGRSAVGEVRWCSLYRLKTSSVAAVLS